MMRMGIRFLAVGVLVAALSRAQDLNAPYLRKQGAATQLMLDGKPFLMLAGEIHNSSSSNLEYMKPIWPRLAMIGLNTVLTPLSWELIEPAEGKYDFALVDGLLEQARQNKLRVVFLWLASWKNGMSSYPPLWVKQDTRRFPRVVENGNEVEILSTLGTGTRDADAKAFAALMHHIREADGRAHTVLMMQVENEVGVLGDTRDHSAAANKAFESAVPKELTAYLQEHHAALFPELRELWEENGAKRSGTWAEVFGDSPRADEIFMAWNYSRYVNYVAAAGKAEYPLPMYVNTWLAYQDATPGDYPSGGPQPRVIDIWKAAGGAIDIYSPDIYQANFEEWCKVYNRAENPLFIPEATGGAAGEQNVFYAIGQHDAMGFSPFAIDSSKDAKSDLGTSYDVLTQLAPLILEHQGRHEIAGFLLDRRKQSTSFVMNGYLVTVSLDDSFGQRAEKGYGLMIASGANEFMGAGSGFRVAFKPRSPSEQAHAGIGDVEEGTFQDGRWVAGRRLNGDENDQGQYWRFSPQGVHIEKARVYRFE
jgi:beta-galactosidase GanA